MYLYLRYISKVSSPTLILSILESSYRFATCASSEYFRAAGSALAPLSPLSPLGISWAAHSCTPQVFSAHLPEAESQKGQPRFGL